MSVIQLILPAIRIAEGAVVTKINGSKPYILVRSLTITGAAEVICENDSVILIPQQFDGKTYQIVPQLKEFVVTMKYKDAIAFLEQLSKE